ncbi:putative membrane protein YczE [Streptomyces filamentosus]|uniref:membrane protein YczE n=1 Tax=Streptomyces filamentosus TaxID=67294 RepID=UPI00381B1C39
MSIASGARGRHLTRRLVQLYAGLTLYGVSSALLVRAGLGMEPWNVLHQGLSELTGLTIGVVSIVVGAIVLLLWIPIRQRPGLGTVSNVFVVGLAMDGSLALLPEAHGLPARVALMVLGIVLNGLATGLYIAARLGPGPRDGLMTGLHRATGRSIRLVRTLIEVAVVATGFLLGGSVGVGTVLYALAIGPLAQFFLRFFAVPEPTPATEPASGTGPVSATGPTPTTGPVSGTGPAPAPTPAPGPAPVSTPEPAAVDAADAAGTPEGAILRR